MCHSLELLVLSCLFLAVESQQGPILPPQHLSLKWIGDFDPQLSWAPPPHSVENCKYKVEANTKSPSDSRGKETSGQSCQLYFVMEGGFLEMTVQTVCKPYSTNHSELARVNFTYPVLVRDWECYIYSATQATCSWDAASHAQDIRFFYWLTLNNFQANENPSPLPSLECSSYHPSNGDVRTGCDLSCDANNSIIDYSIDILFNGMLNGTFARNTFKIEVIKVRPPPLKWTVNKTTDQFLIEWTPVDIPLPWNYFINYTECGRPKTKKITNPYALELDPGCQYRMTIKANATGAETPWNDEKYFDADTDPNAWLYAAVLIPLVLAGLAALMFVCCRKNKEYVFPKVPEPRDLLSDISNNNNESTGHKLYVPPEEEDNCKITLVVDALINRLDI